MLPVRCEIFLSKISVCIFILFKTENSKYKVINIGARRLGSCLKFLKCFFKCFFKFVKVMEKSKILGLQVFRCSVVS